LPIVHPRYNIKNTLVSSYKHIPSASKTDYSLISSSFDTSNDILTTAPFNHSSHIPNPFLATTSFNKSLYNTNFTSTNAEDIVDDPSAFNNASDDLMTTSFGSISLGESTEGIVDDRPNEDFNTGISYDKSLLNEIPYSFNGTNINTITNRTQDNSFISTAFNKPMYESEDIRSNYLASSLDAVDNNIMSTSFSTQSCASLSHSNSFNALTTNSRFEETISSPLTRNAKSSKISDKLLTRILIDTDTFTSMEQSAPVLDNTSNNLMSTSFNYPESDVKGSDIAFSDAFNNENDQSIKPQRSIMQEKKPDAVVPPSVSALSSSLANYLHNLPKKNYPLSRSTPGLTELDESVQKFGRMVQASPHVLQKQNSACNITQKTSTSFRTYRYNYDLDYIPVFHDGTRDDTDLHNLRTTGGKFGSSQNSHLTYDAQHRLCENRHLSKSIQNNINANVGKEIKVFSNVPPLPVINATAVNSKLCSACPPFTESAPVNSNEKPKVKFSDTVTHILVPGTVCRQRERKRQRFLFCIILNLIQNVLYHMSFL